MNAVGVYGQHCERIVDAIHQQSGTNSIVVLPFGSFRDAILSQMAHRFVVAPISDDDMAMATAARKADPTRVFLITGLDGQPDFSGFPADLGPNLETSKLVPSILDFANGVISVPPVTNDPVLDAPIEPMIEAPAPAEAAAVSPELSLTIHSDETDIPRQSFEAPDFDSPAPSNEPSPFEHIEDPPVVAPITVDEYDPYAKRAKLLAMTAPKGGVGKTTLSLAMAYHIAEQSPESKVLFIDGNRQQSDTNSVLFLDQLAENKRSVLDLLRVADLGSAIRDAVINYPNADAPNLQFLLGSEKRSHADPEQLNPAFYRSVVAAARPIWDYIVVDSQVAEQYDTFMTQFLLLEADALLTVTESQITSVSNTEQWEDFLSTPTGAGGAGLHERGVPFAVVLNRFRDIGLGDPSSLASSMLPNSEVLGVIFEDDQWAQNMASGRINATTEKTRHVIGEVLSRLFNDAQFATEPPRAAEKSFLKKLKSQINGSGEPKKPKKPRRGRKKKSSDDDVSDEIDDFEHDEETADF